jgi:hypothetical protein
MRSALDTPRPLPTGVSSESGVAATSSRPSSCSAGERARSSPRGVGYGGLRLAGRQRHRGRRALGPDRLHPQGTRWSCVYAVAEDPNTTGELVAVLLEADRIVLFAVLPVPHARVTPLRTTAGIGITATEDEVRRAYGPPEAAIRGCILYSSLGVGFAITRDEIVRFIVVFPPGTPAERLLDNVGDRPR